MNRTERGWPGHFVCAAECMFRRNTLVEAGERKIVVSTVGNLRNSEGYRTEIGNGRHYETMCFESDGVPPYYDADVSQSLEVFRSLRVTPENEKSVDCLADEMHESAVAEIMEMCRNPRIVG